MLAAGIDLTVMAQERLGKQSCFRPNKTSMKNMILKLGTFRCISIHRVLGKFLPILLTLQS